MTHVEMTTFPEEALIGLNRAATTAKLQAGAVHEVNNALLVISGTAELLQTRTDLPPTVTAAVERLQAQSQRAAAAMMEVLEFVREGHDSRAPVNLKTVTEHALALRQFAIKRARLTSRLDVQGTSFMVSGSRGDLEQALLNVIINAEQAVADRKGTIVVTLAQAPAHVTITVADDGPGFAFDPPAHAMAPFVTTRSPFASAGLGLWAARVLVEAHGGTLEVQSTPDGSTVTFRLPALPPKARG